MWLLEFPKGPISEHPSRVNVFTGINTADTTMAELLLELSIDAMLIELEKVFVSEIWNLRTVR